MLRRTLFLAVSFILLLVIIPSVVALPAYQEEPPCGGETECYDQRPAEPSWDGYSDGRLNPDMAEYYSVWCKNDNLDVWGGSASSPQEVSRIPIRQLIKGPFPFDVRNGLTVNRSGDTITISGSNGYGPNHPGSKTFNLDECIQRNGGEPAAPNEGNNQNAVNPSGCEDPDYALDHIECQDNNLNPNAFGFGCPAFFIFVNGECRLDPNLTTCQNLNYAVENPWECTEGSSVERLWRHALNCINITFFAAAGSVTAFRIRRKRR